MTNNDNMGFPVAAFEGSENLWRIFLKQRFGIDEKLNGQKTNGVQSSTESPIEELHYNVVLLELKRALKSFIEYQTNIDRLVHHIKLVTSQSESMISDTEIKVQYHINIKQLIQAVFAEVYSLDTQDYQEKIAEKLKNKQLVCIAVNTKADNGENGNAEFHIKGMVFFDEKILKINRWNILKNPSIILYKIQNVNVENFEPVIKKMYNSFNEPLEQKNWDNELNQVLNLEKTNKIVRREHAIGNCAWITAKMTMYSIIFAIIFQSLKELGAREMVANKIAVSIAEFWYKLFTIDDRNRSLYSYLTKHGYRTTLEPISMANRTKMLKEFLNNPPKNETYDKELLTKIYIKSLNWLLDEYLKSGDLASAKQLLIEEKNNKLYNPLFFAARNDKEALAELLSNYPEYVNAEDENGNTPFMVASAKGNIDICKILVRHKHRNQLTIESVNHLGFTALHLAVINHKREMVEYLINLAPEILDKKDNRGRTAEQIAAEHNALEIEKILKRGVGSLKGQQKF